MTTPIIKEPRLLREVHSQIVSHPYYVHFKSADKLALASASRAFAQRNGWWVRQFWRWLHADGPRPNACDHYPEHPPAETVVMALMAIAAVPKKKRNRDQ